MDKLSVLKDCKVDGMVVKLPDIQLDRDLYLEVKKALELIGGKWKSGKVKGFVFSQDPTELLEQISNGEKRNLKKEYQFFATPDSIADRLVKLAEIDIDSTILEPSAGQGAIINAINRLYPYKAIDCYELMDINRTFLSKIVTAYIRGNDFLIECDKNYDRIIANPPFSKNQDIDHIYKMYDCLNDNGILVSVASMHWHSCTHKKESEFFSWLVQHKAEIIDIEAGEFKESGTMVSSCIVKIRKSNTPTL
jgi:hypothetical protein